MGDIKRSFSYADIKRQRFNVLELDKHWKEHLGTPELNSSIFICGASGEGKTNYVMQLVKAIAPVQKVLYDSAEEGMRFGFREAMENNGMAAVAGKVQYCSEGYNDLRLRLRRKRQPKVVVIDSAQYFFRGLNIKHYFDLLDEFNDTLFIFISHASGNEPKGKIADDIKFHSDIKILVKDYEAIIQTSRVGGGKSHIIWEKGYRDRKMILTD